MIISYFISKNDSNLVFARNTTPFIISYFISKNDSNWPYCDWQKLQIISYFISKNDSNATVEIDKNDYITSNLISTVVDLLKCY